MNGRNKVMVISLPEAMRLFPDFRPEWQRHHFDCPDPNSVALGHPRFGLVRHIVLVETNEQGQPIKPLFDKFRIEEGSVENSYPGAIVIPWYFEAGICRVVLRKKWRPIRKTHCWEFPQGCSEKDESPIQCAIRELQEETGLIALTVQELVCVCPEPDYYSEGDAVIATEISPDFSSRPGELESFPLDNLEWTNQIDSATTLAALLRFIANLPGS